MLGYNSNFDEKSIECSSTKESAETLYRRFEDYYRQEAKVKSDSDTMLAIRLQEEFWLKQASKQGYPLADQNLCLVLYNIGKYYEETKQFTLALKYFQQSAEQGFILAQFNAGVISISTDPESFEEDAQLGLDKIQEAIKWFKRIVKRPDDEIIVWFKRIMKCGDRAASFKTKQKKAESAFHIGRLLQSINALQDSEFWLKKATQYSHRQALKELKDMTERHVVHVAQNLKMEQLRQEAKQSGDKAYKLSQLYKDMSAPCEAVFWLQQAAIVVWAGQAKAWNDLGFLTFKGYEDQLQPDPRKGMLCFEQSANLDCPEGMFNYGRCLFTGEGGTKDQYRGAIMIQRASQRGNRAALQAMQGSVGRFLKTQENVQSNSKASFHPS